MIEILQKAAEEGGKILLDLFQKEISLSQKASHHDLVTEADIASQKAIKETITNSLIKGGYKKEEIGFIGEEDLKVSGKYQFIIDPLDGTTNFAFGLDIFAVSIAMAENSEIVASVVYGPVKKIFYVAEKGKGSFKIQGRNKIRLVVQEKDLKKSLVSYHYNWRLPIEEQIKHRAELYSKSGGMRTLGTIVLELCYLADNIWGAVVNGNCFIWDIAAAKLIIAEAGGVVTDWQGKEVVYDFNNPKKPLEFIACHPKNLQEIVSIVNK